MLVLSRKENERIHIGDHITITVAQIGRNQVALGIDAPKDMAIVREELVDRRPAPAGETALRPTGLVAAIS